MNFDFSDEQKQFGDELRRLLEEISPLAQARRVLEGGEPYSRDIWAALARMGVQGVLIPEEFGGVGLGYLEACVAAEEIGRALAPVPALSSIYLCAEAIRRYGSQEQKTRWLPGLADGSLVGTWAASERPGEVLAETVKTQWRDGELRGTKQPVIDGVSADLCLVAAVDGAGEVVLTVCDLRGEGASRRALDSVDPTRPSAAIRFDGAAAERLECGLDAWDRYLDLLNRAAVLLAFEQIGAADRALYMARDYALERRAFGKPIGAYQAIKHKLADIYTRNQLARAHAYYGAWALSAEAPELPLAAAGARVAASDAFSFAAQENIQTHGGVGYTWVNDCQFFYRRARLYANALGSSLAWKEQITQRLSGNQAA